MTVWLRRSRFSEMYLKNIAPDCSQIHYSFEENISVADPRFPRGRGANPRGGTNI